MSRPNKYTLEKKAAVKNGVQRMVIAVLSVVINSLLVVWGVIWLNNTWHWLSMLLTVISVLVVLGIYSMYKTASIKMPWIMLIMAMPVAGLVLYLLVGLNGSTNKMRRRYEAIDKVLLPLLPEDSEIQKEIKKDAPYLANITHYIKKYSGYPVYKNTDITYFDDALKGIEAQKDALKQAKEFIFMEYHAIEDAESWHSIQDILEEKVKEGVEVRVFYDDMGSIGFVNTDFVKRLRAKGIRARVFNPFAPGLNLFLNNRDHRKITVIDGKIGFTGGYNIANEYFHLAEPYGFWKDTGIKLEGDAVKSLTVTFLEMWNAIKGNDIDDVTFDRYLRDYEYTAGNKGYVVPYADNPMDGEQVGEEVYMSIANMAKDYVWFITPYLIITEEMTHTLSLAAKRGVDVRIVTPGIPDKKIVYSLTRSYYNGLARNGVKIYEYTPGFCHAKMSIADDFVATCGTINLDYRSLYHHFENGCLYADCDAVKKTKEDFEQIFKESKEVTEYYASGRGAFLRFSQLILRLSAPLM
ncbi:cardiolipin synthase [Butyrivibrio sp.]|uniref:cardiolipin synthase n=1 Tax=Butyrivibrio sp. TaxID=28121 RepID=UPI0025C30A45|nr:cardiolipin synthase [Butyrivibrio sp.]